MSFASWMKNQYEEKAPICWFAFLFELISSLALFSLMLLTCIDVIGRYFFHHPVLGATELTKIGLAIVIFTVMPVITWRGGQIVVDLIDSFLSPKTLQILVGLSSIIVAISLYFVAFRIYAIGARNLKRGIVTDFFYIRTGYVIQYIAIFCWFTALAALVYALSSMLKRNHHQPSGN